MSLDTLAYIKSWSPLKVSVIFALGILLPSGILGILGLRSYQNEHRLMQKETEERYTAVADLVQKRALKQLSDLVTSVKMIAGQAGFQRLEPTEILPVLLSPPPMNDFPGYGLFVLDESDRMVAPWPENVPGVRNGAERSELDWGPLMGEIQRMERMEFVDKNYAGAIQGYKALLAKTSFPALQAALLENIAGDYSKLNEKRHARETYLQLARSYDQRLDLSGIPMGIVGRQMAIQLEDDENSGFKDRLDLFEGLLFHRWPLPALQSEKFLKELQIELEKSVAQAGPISLENRRRWEHLRRVQEQLQNLAEVGKRFAENDRADLLHRVRRTGHLEQGVLLQIPAVGAQNVAVVVPIFVPHTDQRRGLLVAILPADSVWLALKNAVAESTQASGLQVEWDHQPLKGHTLRQLWKPRLQREIDVMDPPLHFSLMDTGASFHDQMFKRRQWIFAGVIGLSFIVIIIGMLIMAQALKQKIEVSNLKADFVANVSHELRTPLTVISQIEEQLIHGWVDSEDEKKEIYSLLSQQTGRLRGLVEDVLDFSKILAGKKEYQREPLELIGLVQEAVELFDPKAEARGFEVLTYYPPAPIPIVGDVRAITQMILNLLDNAMKYSGEARKIEVWVQKTAAQGIVDVKDYGIGISPTNQEKIFEKFYRIEDKRSARLESGVGLGLAMVKHVIEGHKGKILVESQVGKGSIFSLIFPLAQEGK